MALAVDSAAGLRPPVEPGDATILRLARAIEIQRSVGVAPATLRAWANTIPDADGATTIIQAVKARYDETRWLEVARSLNDPLRAERRDALVAYLLPRMRDLGVTNRNQLFEYFLIDVDMNPCMLTSRIRQATGAVQTFFQRCLMNLEPKVSPRIIDDKDWKWLKNYRVWEANRKVFLYPENWIEPELRDDKSPLFQALESTILQQEIKNDNVEAAFADYLEGLDEIARLDVRGVWFEERQSSRMVARRKPRELRMPEAAARESESGQRHVPRLCPHVQRALTSGTTVGLESGRNWTRLGKDRRRHRGRASRPDRVSAPDASVLDDVSRGEQAGAADEQEERGAASYPSAKTGKSSWRIRCTTAADGRERGYPPAA